MLVESIGHLTLGYAGNEKLPHGQGLPSFLWCSWMVAWATAVPGGASHPSQADAWLDVLLPRSSAVEVAAAPPAVGLGPKLALQLHKAPDPGAVGAEVGLDIGGQLADGG